MQSTWVLGTAAGLAIAAFSISSNLRRGDPHHLSAVPDLFGAAAMAFVIVFAVRRASRSADAADARRAAVRTTLVAAVSFSVLFGLFAWQYFPSHSTELAAAAAAMSFVAVALIGLAATYFVTRSDGRMQPGAPAAS